MMDITPPPTTAIATATTHVKNLDPPIQPKKDLRPPFANGLLKRLEPFHHHTPPPVVVSYRECLKNHAASTGGHVVDGCGEFMASPASTPTDPTSLKCAACGCHRNFHRREPDGPFYSFLNNPPLQQLVGYQPHHRHHPPPPLLPPPPPPPPQPVSPTDSLSPPPISSCYYPSAPQMLLALSSGVPENPVHHLSIPVSGGLTTSNSNTTGKKRFRTKFSEDQKEKMREMAERVGWKMQKEDEKMIIGFCNEIGVDKGVFKVWMHNHKMRFAGKKEFGNHLQLLPSNDSISSGGGSGNATATNGSSSSS